MLQNFSRENMISTCFSWEVKSRKEVKYKDLCLWMCKWVPHSNLNENNLSWCSSIKLLKLLTILAILPLTLNSHILGKCTITLLTSVRYKVLLSCFSIFFVWLQRESFFSHRNKKIHKNLFLYLWCFFPLSIGYLYKCLYKCLWNGLLGKSKEHGSK